MSGREPSTEVDTRFSAPGAIASPWSDAVRELEDAQTYWLSTIRRDLRPHVTTILAFWSDDALWFCTGPGEQKARNLAHNPACTVTTGRNELSSGLDIVVKGAAVRVTDDTALQPIAVGYAAKYGPDWRFTVLDGAFFQDAGEAHVYAVRPLVVFGFRKGDFAQIRWQLGRDRADGEERGRPSA